MHTKYDVGGACNAKILTACMEKNYCIIQNTKLDALLFCDIQIHFRSVTVFIGTQFIGTQFYNRPYS